MSFAYSCAALDKISAAQSLFYKTELLVLRFVYVTYIYYVVPSRRGPAYTGPMRPFYNRPIGLAQERSSLVNVCECVRD